MSNGVQEDQMHTVVEMPSYRAAAEDLLGSDGMISVVQAVAADPEIGEVIRGRVDFASSVRRGPVWGSAEAFG